MYYYMIATIGICGFFSWLDWGDGCGEENGCEEMKCLSHHTETRAHAVNMTYHCDADLNHLVEVVPVRYLLCKASLSPLTVLYPLEEVIISSPHLRVGSPAPPGGQSICINHLGFLCLGNVSSPPFIYLFNYSCSVSMDSWIFSLHFGL